MKTLKVLSVLLSYPDEAVIAALQELKDVLGKEALLPKAERHALEALIDDLADNDLMDAQERYILLFDRTRSLSLHLFEHVHGESRDRGQAMVDLIKVYADQGFSPVSTELPDYLPLFLEYASLLPAQDAVDLIGQPSHVFAALHERLKKRQSHYAAVFATLLAMTRLKPDSEMLARLLAEPDPEPDDLEALDAAWEEEEVLFGPAASDPCGRDRLIPKLRQARRPAPGLEPVAGAGPRTLINTPKTHSIGENL